MAEPSILSNRGKWVVKTGDTFGSIEKEVISHLYDKVKRPDGYIRLSVAENVWEAFSMQNQACC